VNFVGLDGTEKTIFCASDRTVRDPGSFRGAEIIGETVPVGDRQQLRIRLLTMTRLKHDNRFVTSLPFHVLVRGLLRRISSLMYFHQGEELDVDFAGLIARATQVETLSEDTRWVDWDRYSGRRDARITLGGLVGTVTYAGDLNEFWPLLKIGEYVHVGKGAVFGMGKYRLEENL
jgi:CRISPR/Cas system endoribonuclease Cas6 (RAMP superfamily)